MITQLRSIIFYTGLLPLTVLFSLIGLLILPLPQQTRYFIITRWSVLTIAWLKLSCGLSFRVTGAENIPAQPGVILCKHQSAWETITMQLIFPPQCQVLKKELLRLPFFGWGLACLNPLAIDRSAGTRALKYILKEGAERISGGWWVLLFPEGTRVPLGQSGRYTQTGAALAKSAQCPLVPVAHNAGLFWARNSVRKHAGVIDVVIGQPLETAEKSTREIMAEAQAWIESNCRKLPATLD